MPQYIHFFIPSSIPVRENQSAFDITESQAKVMLNAPLNANGRPNSDVVKPWVNGTAVVRRPTNMWVIDFGVAMSMDEAESFRLPFSYVEQHVKPHYEEKRTKWWLHERSRPEMREALRPLSRFIVTARVSKHRIF
jgi:hypothetical protein